ncbi:hypothetical protein CHH77_10785 [Shouchella clausii]|jgi:hypothetical protein|uniref:Uncharacterized protein n=1 Tax=Shouchella clausii TaxID=79880 RepID=A0A268P1E0_SHOCL|nr:hypothetical protein DB29_03692 [Shouchella clausii]KKI87657.1 hypothetical protein WZ76_04135 [Shouchella clausii]PAE82457.1 hypothetical protein CHH77_10785 [Shouchella clausii]PAE89518.1 hypothetical protein CHH72_07720 [Shouchella clausii]PAF10750.1 hypothetical protein CHH65_04070 [Shouchella clausii]
MLIHAVTSFTKTVSLYFTSFGGEKKVVLQMSEGRGTKRLVHVQFCPRKKASTLVGACKKRLLV